MLLDQPRVAFDAWDGRRPRTFARFGLPDSAGLGPACAPSRSHDCIALITSAEPPTNVATPPTLPQVVAAHPPHFGGHPLVVDKLRTPPLKPPGQADGENPFDRRH